MSTYSAAEVTVSWGDIIISGFSESDFVEAEMDEPAFTITKGISSAHFNRQSSRTGKVTIRTIGSSLVNDQLSNALVADRLAGGGAKPFMVKDPSGASFVKCATARLEKEPGWKRGKELGEVEWVFISTEMEIFHGGTTSP